MMIKLASVFHLAALVPGIMLFLFTFGADVAQSATVNTSDTVYDYYGTREDWSPTSTGMENVSVFVYSDGDRTGQQDIGDRPLAGIVVKLTAPDGSSLSRTSNLYGFANFTTSLGNSYSDINQEGIYRVEVLPPPGWKLSGTTTVQEIEFAEVADSRVGLVGSRAPEEVGLYRQLSIHGSVSRSSADQPAPNYPGMVLATSSSGSLKLQLLEADKSYSIAAYPGLWVIQRLSEEGGSYDTRIVHLSDTPVRLSERSDLDWNDLRWNRTRKVLDFGKVAGGKARKMPSGWCGLHWKNLVVTEFDTYRGAGYANGRRAGQHVGYNSSGYPVTVYSGSRFDFHGAYFGGAWPEAEGETLTVTAWRDDEKAGYAQFTLSAYGPTWLQADFAEITRLEISTKHYWQFVMDKPEFSFSEQCSG